MNAWLRIAGPTATPIVTTSTTSEPSAERLCFGGAAIASERPDPAGRPVGEERLADQPRARHRPPVAAVERVAAVVPHHVVVAGRHGDRLPEVALGRVAARLGAPAPLRPAVSDHLPVDDGDPVTGQPHDALDVGLRGLAPAGHVARGSLRFAERVYALLRVGAG